MEESIRAYAGLRLARAQEELATSQKDFTMDEAAARQSVVDAERFVARLERFLREIGAL